MTVPLETTTGVEPATLAAWMNDQGLGSGQISDIHRLTGGTQNILVSFVRDGRTYVLRRPPLNKGCIFYIGMNICYLRYESSRIRRVRVF